MDVSRLSYGKRIAGISATLLFVFMFFDWFGVESSSTSLSLFNVGHSAWEALDYIPIILSVGIIAVLVETGLRLTGAGWKRAPLANAVITILGVMSALLIIIRIVDPPSFGSFGTSFGIVTHEGTVKLPIFLALLAAAGIAYGGYRAMREEGISLADLRARRRRGQGRVRTRGDG